MYEFLLASAFGTYDIITAAYWVCLIVGGGMVLISALGASGSGAETDIDGGFDLGGDADIDFETGGDLEFDVDLQHAPHAADAGYASLAAWFSVRFMIFFAAVFGAVGVIFKYLSDMAPWSVFYLALVAGLVVGQGVQQLFMLIRRTSGDSAPRPSDYVNRLGRVTLAIKGQDKGEVAIQVRGSRRCIPAVACRDAGNFMVGDEVVVVGYSAGTARVLSRQAYETMRADSPPGGI